MTANNRRHVITRILRYFPDIKWETAADIVDTAVFDGKALVRVLNSLVTHTSNYLSYYRNAGTVYNTYMYVGQARPLV